MNRYYTPHPTKRCPLCQTTFTPTEHTRVRVRPGTLTVIEYLCPECSQPAQAPPAHNIFHNAIAKTRTEGN